LNSCGNGASKKDVQSTDALISPHWILRLNPEMIFFLYANGKWFKQHPIPASEPYNGIFQLIQDTINAQIRHICESSAALTNCCKRKQQTKIGDFFFSGMDSVTLNKKEFQI